MSEICIEPELNLLLEWPARRSRSQWTAIFGASVSIHLLLFFAAIHVPSFVQSEPERTVVVKRTLLYLPRDVLTQKEPNRQKVSKQIDLSDLLTSRSARPQISAPSPSRKRFEVPKTAPQQIAKNTPPQITAEAPEVKLNQTPVPLPPGSQTGLTAPPPPAPTQNPFQNVGSESDKKTSRTLQPANSLVRAAVEGLAHDSNSRKLVVSDNVQSAPMPGPPGSIGQMLGQHAAVELQSDPQGADFKPYLARILSIVRTNWRTVIPESVRMGTRRGRTVIEFAINRDGSIPKLVIADPSGSEPLDRAAVAGLSMSNPLPPLPPDYKGLQVRLAFSFSYNMPAQ